MAHYLVTGGTGFIGSALVNRLLSEGHKVRCLDNDFRGRSNKFNKSERLELIQADIRDARRVIEAGAGIDSILHLAYINGTEYFYTKPDLVLDVAVRGMMNVIDSCKINSIPHFVLASSSEVYQSPPEIPTPETVPMIVPDPLNPRYSYGGGKIICELLALHQLALIVPRVSIFRPHNVYGPDMGREHVIPQFILRARAQIEKLKSGDLPFEIQGDGRQKRSFIYIDDFVDGVMRVIDRGGHREIYHIGTDQELSMKDVAEKVVKSMGRIPRIIPGPEPLGATPRRVPLTDKIKKLGFNPKVPFEEGLAKTIAWYREVDL